MPNTTANYPDESNYEKRRKLDDTGGIAAPPNHLPSYGGGPRDPRYHYEMYPIPGPVRHAYHDDGHYREPPSMPYPSRVPPPSPKHPYAHPGYAYPPPPKEYYHNSYHMTEYPPYPGWGHPPPYHHPKGGQMISPRFNRPYEYDNRHYQTTEPNGNRPKAAPTAATVDESYQSPTSVVNTLDTRSPEGSRNLNPFEERVSGGVPPPVMTYPPPHHQPYPYSQPIHSPAQAGAPAPTSRQWWSCDFCSYKFSSWEECSAHESMCPSRTQGSASKKRSFDGELESRFMDPSEEYANNSDRPTFSLAQPHDGQSLSDRQCYVRTHFVEVFVANEGDVSARHSRGAQKLHMNQVGLRCAYCAKLKPRDRAERAVCYPSSISRIYQTVADMQRFHFEACPAIPQKVLRVYKSLKTTRPRGVGSPQSYWDKSAREMGLIDTDCGIMLKEGCELIPRNEEGECAGGAAPIPSLTSDDIHASVSETFQKEDTKEEEKEEDHHGMVEDNGQETHGARSQAPSEADASILLMLKNPETTPKTNEDVVPV